MENNKEKRIEKERPEEKKVPLCVKLQAARADMTIAILNVQNEYGLPAYLTDLIVSACLSDIRDCASKELIKK